MGVLDLALVLVLAPDLALGLSPVLLRTVFELVSDPLVFLAVDLVLVLVLVLPLDYSVLLLALVLMPALGLALVLMRALLLLPYWPSCCRKD